MGINRQSLKLLLFENSYKSIRGKVLLIGRSTVCIEYSFIKELFSRFGLNPPLRSLSRKITKHQNDNYNVDDIELIHSLSIDIESVDVLDVSAYEGAHIVCDLNYPIPEELIGKYDFIYDSSVIDNLFNPAEAIKNITKMLKPNGRYMGYNVCSFYPGAMSSCHPEWFYGFFAVNHFQDVKVYLTEHVFPGINRFEYTTTLYRYRPIFTLKSDYNHFQAATETCGVYHCMIISEKSEHENLPYKFPINLQYVSSSNIDNWADMEDCYVATKRPIIKPLDARLFEKNSKNIICCGGKTPHHTDHYLYIGNNF